MKKMTYQEAKQKFIDQGRTDIELLEENFVSWKRNKATFFDKIIGEIFWATPSNVYKQKSSHPKRAKEQRRQTNIEKYGNVCSLHGKETEKKTKKTNLKKYGVENPFQSKIIKKKIKKTNLEKYGVDNPSQCEAVKQKKRNTCLEHYGTEYPAQSKNIMLKMKQTCLKIHGGTHPSFLKKKIVAETGENIEIWLAQQTSTNSREIPYYRSLVSNHLNGKKAWTIDELNKIIDNFNDNKTSIERTMSSLLNAPHYNKMVHNYRPDFKLNETLYVNVDGLYWHSSHQKEKTYHQELRKTFENAGIEVLQIREDELTKQPNIVKSVVLNKQGLTPNKVAARKTVVRTVSQTTAEEFLKKNHLMGSIKAKHIGLYTKDANNLLVELLSYKQHKNIVNIERFCSLVNHSVVGGFSKLLSHLEKNCCADETTEISNWVDLRYGTGKHLLTKGFTQTKETLGWKWTDGTNTWNRLRCRANMDSRKLTEKQHAEELGWYRIYDAGQRLYVKAL